MTSILRPDAITPRAYQENIVKEALDKNTLAVLPTGLGKTLISAMVAAKIMDRSPGAKVLMMAPTRPLVMQHRRSFKELLILDEDDLVVMTGHIPPTGRERMWQGGQVFFTTPQIVGNDIDKGRLDLSDFGLVVFDEAHRAVKGYSYTRIARHYLENGYYPVILGLTASPGGNKARVQEVCENLSIERLIYRSHDDEDVAPYVNTIKTYWKEIELPQEYRQISKLLGSMLDARLRKLRAHHTIEGSYVGKAQLLSLGQALKGKLQHATASERGLIFASLLLQSSCLSLLHCIEILESQGIKNLQRFLNRVEAQSHERRPYKNLLNDPLYAPMKKMVDDTIDIPHPKIEELRLEIIGQIGRSSRSKVLVFTQYRDSAALLVSALRNPVFAVERFVGQTSKPGDEGLSQVEQAKVLDRFRNGDISVLVATSVAEEGLDIPDVDLVIFYEPIPSEIRYIQRRGRTGRNYAGRLVILATRDSIDTAYYFASQRKIKKMREVMSSLDLVLPTFSRSPRPKVWPIREGAPARAANSLGNKIGPDHGPRAGPTKGSAIQTKPPSSEHYLRAWILRALEGRNRVFMEDLLRDGAVDGHGPDPIKQEVAALLEEDIIYRPRWDMVAKVERGTRPGRNILEVTVRSVFSGGAKVTLADGTEATLYPEGFPDHPSYIRKGRTFKVKGELYESRGRNNLRVFEVLE